MLTDKPPLAIDGNAVSSSQASLSIGSLRANISLNACSSETESVFSGAYNNPVDRWSTCIPDAGLEIARGIYGNSSSLPSPSRGYGRQLPQRPHAAFETRLPSLSHNGQLYNAEELCTLDPSYYHQLVSPSVPYVASQNPISQTKLPISINPVGESNRFGSRPDHLPSWGSLGGGSNFSGNSRGPKFSWQEVDGFESGGLWSDWSNPLNGKSSLAHLRSVPAFSKRIGSLDLVGNYFGMASRPKESFYGVGSHLGGHSSYLQGGRDRDSSYGVVSTSDFGINDRNWPTLDEARRGGRCNDFPCSCTVAVDTIGERNKGPRAFKPRNQKTANGSGNTCKSMVADSDAVSYNFLDFVTDYKEAKFFVIKSYSEDNVHKSIKYGVWASTANGNNKLDAAYREAKEKDGACPVFLLFSVNASAQFCGVAEMVGPVDFDKSVDYWQQDKWSGQFPVKWHIVKDIPNSQFRHIVLESNDNKPVTNSRDTQEVELKQGIEMLKIFKDYESHSSLLDDFHFYEERQKALQAKKSRQRASVESAKVAGHGDGNSVSPSNDLIKKMSKSFAEAVSLSENETKLPFAYMP